MLIYWLVVVIRINKNISALDVVFAGGNWVIPGRSLYFLEKITWRRFKLAPSKK